jgi:hypothetical protein
VNSGGGAASWLYNKLLKAFSETLSTTVEHEMQLAIEAALIDIQVTHPRILTHFHASSRILTHPHALSRILTHPHALSCIHTADRGNKSHHTNSATS